LGYNDYHPAARTNGLLILVYFERRYNISRAIRATKYQRIWHKTSLDFFFSQTILALSPIAARSVRAAAELHLRRSKGNRTGRVTGMSASSRL
jgi:hypothetical protein